MRVRVRRMYCQYNCSGSAFHFFLNCSLPESLDERPKWKVRAPIRRHA